MPTRMDELVSRDVLTRNGEERAVYLLLTGTTRATL